MYRAAIGLKPRDARATRSWVTHYRTRASTRTPSQLSARQSGSRRITWTRTSASAMHSQHPASWTTRSPAIARRSDQTGSCPGPLIPRQRCRPTHTSEAPLEQDKLDEAVTAFREAIRLKPDDVESRMSMAYALQIQEKLDEAVAAYREAIRLKPDYAEAHYNLGTVLYEQEKFDEAEAEFDEARRLKPGIDEEP